MKQPLIRIFTIALTAGLAGLPLLGFGDSTWNGSTGTDWNTAGTWSAGVPSGANAMINTIAPNICTITATLSATPVDIHIGTSSGATAQVNHPAGNAFTGNGNWFFLAHSGSTGIYNLCDTTTTGGTFTGYGQGSGSLYVGGTANPNGVMHLGLDSGTVATFNMNSSGTLAADSMFIGGNASAIGTFNLDHGTVTMASDFRVCGDFWGPGNLGIFKMSGGSVTANTIGVSRANGGGDSSPGTALITGGTLNAKQWFTLGFCGTSASVGTVTNNGGIINVNTSGGGNLEMTVYDSAVAQFTLISGSVNLWNNASIIFGSGNNTGSAVFDQYGGTVTFFSDAGTTIGGTGSLNLRGGWVSGGTYTYNLNGGLLIVPSVTQGGSGSGVFSFNGGVLKPTANNANFLNGLSGAYVSSGGAIIDTTNFNVTIPEYLSDGGGGLTKLGTGTLTLAGGYGYSGPTVVKAGTLSLDAARTSSYSDLTVSNAMLSLSLNNGAASINAGNLTLRSNTVLNLDFGTATSPSAAAIYASGYSVSNTGSNVINVAGAHLAKGQYPLIYTGGPVSTNRFKLGTLPTGVSAVLTNSGTSLDLLITASGQNLTWYGADAGGNPLTTWDINNSMNWNTGAAKYLQYGGNSYGDIVTFDDYLFTASDADITLNTRVVPANVTFNNNSLPYSITGSGGISGAASLAISGSGSVFLGTSNSFSGGTVISAGILAVTNDNALGASSSTMTLAGGTLQFSNSAAGVRSFNVTSSSTIAVSAGASVLLSGTISGNATLTKNDLGTLTVSNVVSTGSLVFDNGTGVVAGAAAPGNSELWVAEGAGNQGTLNVVPGATLTVNNWLVMGRDGGNGTLNVNGGTVIEKGGGNITCGTGGGANVAVGTINLNSGVITNAVGGETYIAEGNSDLDYGFYNQSGGNAWLGNLYIGRAVSWAGSGIGQANVTGGTLNVANLDIAYSDNNTKIGTNVMTIGPAATVNASGFVRLGFAGSAARVGILTNSGTLNVGSTALYLSYWPDGCSGHVVQNGGALNLQNNSSIIFALNGFQVSTNDFVQNGGNVTFYSDAGVTIGGTGSLNLCNAGTANDTYTLAGGTLTVPQIQHVSGSGTSIFNFNGGTLKAAGSSATFLQGLTAANVMTNGAVIDTAGNNVTIAQALLDGDGLGGGLTKFGSGTLTVSGANSYTGNTTVTAGTLELAMAYLATNSTVSVSNGAVLKLDFSGVNDVAALVLNGVTQSPGAYNSNNTPAYISGPGSLVVPGAGPGTFTSVPGITHFALNGANVVITGTNGQANDAYYLLMTTNLSLPRNQWKTVATNVLPASGSFTFTGTNVVTAGNKQQFYILSSTNYNH